ncbi:MAG: ABC transporter ATP-binding protein [Terriglobia bacterium]
MPPDTTPTECVLEARGLFKYYGDFTALRDITLRIATGEPVLIYGPNGAGKTTLLRALASLAVPSEGEVLLGGLRLNRHAACKSKIGFASHATFLYGDLSVRENLELAGRLFGLTRLETRIDAVLDSFSLQDRARELVRSLSRGLQQRATLARALLHNPDFLLLDEPFTGLDAESTARLEALVKEWAQQGKAVIFSTHGFAQGAALARRLVALDRGRLRYDGPMEHAPLASLGIDGRAAPLSISNF